MDNIELNYNIYSLIDFLGFFQGLILGIILLVLHFRKKKPTFFLSLYILATAINLIPGILQDLNIHLFYPWVYALPFHFYFLCFPLLYAYILKLSSTQKIRIYHWVFIPGIIEFLSGVLVFFQSYQTKKEIENQYFYTLYPVLGILFSLVICVLILLRIRKLKNAIPNLYSDTQNKTLNWLSVYIFIQIGYLTFMLFGTVYMTDFTYYTYSVINVILLYLISIKGIMQKPVVLFFESEEKDLERSSSSANKEKEEVPYALFAQMRTTMDAIEQYIKRTKCYTKNGFTIINLAEGLHMHPKKVSTTINKVKGVNFNTYINSHRVEEAKRLMTSDEGKNLSIEGIGIEVGFSNKSSFYKAFKQMEGNTPAHFQSQ